MLRQHQRTVRISTTGRGLFDITAEVRDVAKDAAMTTGMATLFIRHTSASLVIQENADPAVLRDLAKWISALAPEDGNAYEHTDEGVDDMPAHLRAAVTKTSESIPVVGGALALGRWQAVYLFEHRRAPHTREVVVHLLGE